MHLYQFDFGSNYVFTVFKVSHTVLLVKNYWRIFFCKKGYADATSSGKPLTVDDPEIESKDRLQ